MDKRTVQVPNINCGHCVNTVQTELSELPGVQSVQASHETKQVTVSWESPATWQQIEQTLVEINYPPAGASNVSLQP
jgi:copper chaperone